MEHINKQLEVNYTNVGSTKKSITEGINILVLIVLGCTGLYFYSSLNGQKKSNNAYSPITIDNYAAFNSTEKSKPAERFLSQQLIIDGNKEAGEKISITIDGYDKKAEYTIDFGDGKQIKSNTEKFEHTYDQPGDYNINLNVTYDQEQAQNIIENIVIEKSIEVPAEAYFEQ